MGAVLAIPFSFLIHQLSSSNEGIIHIFKEFLAFWYITSWKRRTKKRFDLYEYGNTADLYQLGMKVPPAEQKAEYPKQNLEFSKNVDAIQFYGANSKNEKLFVRISRTSQDQANIWLQLILAKDKRYTLPMHKEWKTPKTGEDCFAAGGLRIRCLVPMRRWRISFNGIMNETIGKKTENVHVKFSFIWVAGSEIYDTMNDISSMQLAKFLAKQKWGGIFPPDFQQITKYLDSYEQFGNVIGTVSVSTGIEEEIILWGTKKRSVEIYESRAPNDIINFFGCLKDGESFNFGRVKFPHLNSELQYGYLLHSNGFYSLLDDYEMRISTADNEKDMTVVKNVLFCEGTTGKKIHIDTSTSSSKFLDSSNPANSTIVQWSPIKFAEETGNGIIMTACRSNKHVRKRTSEKLLKITPKVTETSLVASLEELGENSNAITGGKAASLGKLMTIGQIDKNVLVPKGLVVTTVAYEEFLKNNKVVRDKISHLEDVARGKIKENLEQICLNTVKEISHEELPEKIQFHLRSALEKIFPDTFHTMKFAVRSSATGEDSEEMSAAGQMETLLGIQGFQEITKAVVKCWASQFSYTAIQYKRQYGQVLNSPMAVVVQEMVPSYVAGVIFTCDPLTGNPELITITANYGIGESVVSASADPDTITLKRDLTGKVKLEKMQVGKKKTKIVMSEVNCGVEEKKVDPADSEHCCLSKSMATALAEIAIRIEDEYACPMDIEWAMKGGKIYLLQARPVTTFDKETDFEIIHEQDSFLIAENEYLTIANAGEVLPGACSYLGMSHLLTQWNVMCNRTFVKRNPNMKFSNPYTIRMSYLNSQRTFLNIAEFILRFHVKDDSFMTTGNVISMFGRMLDDQEMFEAALKRNKNYPNSWKSSALVQMFLVIKDMLTVGRAIKKTAEKFKKYEINLEHCKDLQSMLDEIRTQSSSDIMKGQIAHMYATAVSSIWNMLLLYILHSASGTWNSDVFSDFSLLLSSINNIESAQVPNAMQNLSRKISKCIEASIFCAMNSEDALKWLKESKAGSEFEKFLEDHGHRSIKEFDIRTKTWGIDPLPLVKILQEMVGNVPVLERSMPKKKTKQNINTPLSFTSKLMLKILLPFARNGVAQRESGKSMLVNATHKVRLAYMKMSKKMVEEGILADEDLMHFLSVTELEQVIQTRSPRLVQKAIRRRAIFPKLDALEYPEICKGFPKPINIEEENYVNDAVFTMKGIPVSRGIAKGPARVAKSLEEARAIQQGEILIAHSTDIGWSPYFPFLAGISTELGGLISHGAVVAREYGLPCVVSVHNATNKFKTGDLVLLDGNKGILQKIEGSETIPKTL